MIAVAALVGAATAMVGHVPARADVVMLASFPAPTRMITVASEAIHDTTATLTAWERDASGRWVSVIGPTEADLGPAGLGVPRDNIWRTPMGTFALDQAFGNQPDPGTKMAWPSRFWWVLVSVSAGRPHQNPPSSGAALEFERHHLLVVAVFAGRGDHLDLGAGLFDDRCVRVEHR